MVPYDDVMLIKVHENTARDLVSHPLSLPPSTPRHPTLTPEILKHELNLRL